MISTRGRRAGGIDGASSAERTGHDGFACGRQDGPLTATSRTPHARTRPLARLVRAGLRVPAALAAGSAIAPGAARRRLGAVLAGSGLAALVGLTAWAVSFVSVWLVPAYLALMVVILAGPRGAPAGPAWKSGVDRAGVNDAELGRDSGTDRNAGADPLLPAGESDPVVPAGGVVAAPTPDPDPGLAGTGSGKPRRSRARARKAVRTAVEPVPDSPPVTWIRVGPGKFVRADRGLPVSDQATAQAVADAGPPPGPSAEPFATTAEAAAQAHPATDEPARATPTSEAATPAEPDSHDATEATPHVEGPVPALATGERDSDSVPEEYGIAPSAFEPTTADPPLADVLDHGDAGESNRSEVDLASATGLDGKPSGHHAGAGRPRSGRRGLSAPPAFLPRGIANATPRPGPAAASPRRRARSGFPRRTAVGSRSGPVRRRVPSARGASRPVTYAQRGWRARAPPRHRVGTSPIRIACAMASKPSLSRALSASRPGRE